MTDQARPSPFVPPAGAAAPFRFVENPRGYWLGAEKLDSVTAVLGGLGITDSEFFTWKGTMRGKAAHIGAHLVETGGVDWATVKKTEEFLQTAVEPYIRAWARFLKETGWRSVKLEEPNYHRVYRYAGTPDRVGFWPDGLWPKEPRFDVQEGLLDIKTGAPQDWWELQLGGYDEMEPRLSARGARRLTDVCLTDKGDWYPVHRKDVNAGRIFLAMNASFQWGRRHGAFHERQIDAAVSDPAYDAPVQY